jgi:hypothetical protein
MWQAFYEGVVKLSIACRVVITIKTSFLSKYRSIQGMRQSEGTSDGKAGLFTFNKLNVMWDVSGDPLQKLIQRKCPVY